MSSQLEKKSADIAPAKKIPNGIKFVIGGLAGMGATCLVQPFDLVKTRMQLSGEGKGQREYKNSFHCIQTVIRKEGFFGLYKGVDAGLLRQATYTTSRLGMYTYLVDMYRTQYGCSPTVLASMGMGIVAGAVGAFVGTPAEVALIRMMSDKKLPEAERRNYKHVADALTRIVKEEGVFALWRGCLPTITRAMVINMSQLASYSQFKNYFHQGPLQMQEGIFLHFVASMCSGLLTTIVSMPLDMAKTRIQNMKMIDGKPEYKGTFDVLMRVARHEGVTSLWKGFTPYYCRLGPHTVFTFIFLEQLNKLYYKYALGIDAKGSSL